MPHLRTKRKKVPNSKNIGRLIFSIIVVFILMLFIFSLGNIFKGAKLNLENVFAFNINKNKDTEKLDTDNTWILQSDSILSTQKNDSIFIQTSDTDESREKGLSDKEKLKYYEADGKIMTEGMLFVFPVEEIESFWMKDMKFDLDMIWLDSDYKIVHIEKNALADSYIKNNPDSSKLYSNDKNSLAKYILEINSGLADKLDLKLGDKLDLQK